MPGSVAVIHAHEILHLFKRACSDGDIEVAEKLLQTLELIDERQTGAAATYPLAPVTTASGGPTDLERSQIFDRMSALKLHGMRSACD